MCSFKVIGIVLLLISTTTLNKGSFLNTYSALNDIFDEFDYRDFVSPGKTHISLKKYIHPFIHLYMKFTSRDVFCICGTFEITFFVIKRGMVIVYNSCKRVFLSKSIFRKMFLFNSFHVFSFALIQSELRPISLGEISI